MSQQLTPHFTLEEFTRSATAKAHGIDNTPPLSAISSIHNLCQQVLEPLRTHFDTPIIIGSGYRCTKVNTLVGGAKRSQHMVGEAADIHLPTLEQGKAWFDYIRHTLPFDQLIWERASPHSTCYWIHVSCRRDSARNRHEVIEYLEKSKV